MTLCSSPSTITFTGVDERTSVTELMSLLAMDPHIEIGLLYSATPEGRNRYPRLDWLRSAVRLLQSRCALHVCGRIARAELTAGKLETLVRDVARVQVNGQIDTTELLALAVRTPVLVTQHNARNEVLAEIPLAKHQLLVDGSGGRGLAPDAWRRPWTSKPVGFAGGLCAKALPVELPRIARAAQGAWWIDMKGALRTREDWFDVGHAQDVVQTLRALEGAR